MKKSLRNWADNFKGSVKNDLRWYLCWSVSFVTERISLEMPMEKDLMELKQHGLQRSTRAIGSYLTVSWMIWRMNSSHEYVVWCSIPFTLVVFTVIQYLLYQFLTKIFGDLDPYISLHLELLNGKNKGGRMLFIFYWILKRIYLSMDVWPSRWPQHVILHELSCSLPYGEIVRSFKHDGGWDARDDCHIVTIFREITHVSLEAGWKLIVNHLKRAKPCTRAGLE